MAWTFGQRYAVADAVERWWSPEVKAEADDRQRLRLVGLVRDPVDSMREGGRLEVVRCCV